MINKLAKEIHQNAINKGFFENEKNIGEMLCLIHSEVSEALEADRNENFAQMKEFKDNYGSVHDVDPDLCSQDKYYKLFFEESIKNTFEDELADIMIRVMDLAAYKGVDLDEHIRIKMIYNSFREHKHGKKY